jgi:hypothetical protein
MEVKDYKQVNMKINEIRLAFIITKLKLVRALLTPILRLHIRIRLRRRGQ